MIKLTTASIAKEKKKFSVVYTDAEDMETKRNASMLHTKEGPAICTPRCSTEMLWFRTKSTSMTLAGRRF